MHVGYSPLSSQAILTQFNNFSSFSNFIAGYYHSMSINLTENFMTALLELLMKVTALLECFNRFTGAELKGPVMVLKSIL